MNGLYRTAVLFACVAAQTTVMPVSFSGVRPDFIVAGLVFFALEEGQYAGATIGFLLGLFMDMAGSGVPGFNTAVKLMVGLSAGLSKRMLFSEKYGIQTLIVFVMCVLDGLFSAALFSLTGGPGEGVVSRTALYTAAYTALISPFIFAFLRALRTVLALKPAAEK